MLFCVVLVKSCGNLLTTTGDSTMDRSRNDVYQRTIDEQNQKLEKYQAKLRGYCNHSLKFVLLLLWLTKSTFWMLISYLKH